nr:hypothetical protein [Micromonospora sp. CB01531]
MYLRKIQRRNKDGSVVRYLQLAHNRCKDGTTQAEVLVNFGREDRLDVDGLRRLVASINRYLGDEEDAAALGSEEVGPLTVEASRPIGASWLLDGLWRLLGIDAALTSRIGGRRFRTDVERTIFALAANRAIAPSSKLAAAEWASQDQVIPGLDALTEQHAYRAMDLLVAADTQAAVQEAVFFSAAHLLNCEVDLVFFGTTCTYFERDTADDPDGEGSSLRQYGTPRTTAGTRRRSSSDWPSPARASRCAGADQGSPGRGREEGAGQGRHERQAHHHRLGRTPPQGRVRPAGPPHSRPVAQAAPHHRTAVHQRCQGHRRGPPGRQIPPRHQRP